MKLKLDNVFYKYRSAPKTVINGITFEMTESKLGLIGSSGSGKSTLIHLLNGMKVPMYGKIEVGDFEFDNTSQPKKLQDLRKQVAIVYQFTDLQLFAETVKQELKFAVDNFGIEKEDIDSEIKMYFEKFNLDIEYLKSSPFSLSGGQKKKVAIITMLLIDPKLLILDEPTVGLDPQSVEDILHAIDDLTKHGLKVIMISHDMNAIHSFCDSILEMHGGMKTFDGSAYDYFKVKYRRKQLLLLPTHLSYGASIDTENVLFDKLWEGHDLAEFLEEKHV